MFSIEDVGRAVYVEVEFPQRLLSDDILLFADPTAADNIDDKCHDITKPRIF